MDSTRVDKWLWAVRAYKTRSAASTACQAGHVDVNGSGAKPATAVRVGDRVTVRVAVAQVIDKRVGAALAADCLVDHSPPPPAAGEAAPVAARERGAGRPTKRDRRALDRYRHP